MMAENGKEVEHSLFTVVHKVCIWKIEPSFILYSGGKNSKRGSRSEAITIKKKSIAKLEFQGHESAIEVKNIDKDTINVF